MEFRDGCSFYLCEDLLWKSFGNLVDIGINAGLLQASSLGLCKSDDMAIEGELATVSINALPRICGQRRFEELT